ncbi:MAG: acyl-CoA desaturase, partial [Acidobacteriota bacterium]
MIEFDEAINEKVNWIRAIPFIAVHIVAVVGIFYVPPTLELVLLAVALYIIRMWGIIVGYHRYFSHRSFKTSRAFQLVMALIGSASVQKGPLWWAAHHRHHHRHSDQEPDLHSPTIRGFFWSHLGWILCDKYHATEHHKIRDFMKYPELRWLDRYHLAFPIAMGALLWLTMGFDAFLWGGLISTVALWHGTFTINSLAHVYGKRRFKTKDTSRNNLLLSLVTLGEGWHNNHHYYPASARQGFYWWEIDIGYYSLKVLEFFRIVWDVRGVPQRVLDKGRQKA